MYSLGLSKKKKNRQSLLSSVKGDFHLQNKMENSPLLSAEVMVKQSLTKKEVKICFYMKDCKLGRRCMFMNWASCKRGPPQISFQVLNGEFLIMD